MSQKDYYHNAPSKHYRIDWNPSEKLLVLIKQIAAYREKGMTYPKIAEIVHRHRTHVVALYTWYLKFVKGGEKK